MRLFSDGYEWRTDMNLKFHLNTLIGGAEPRHICGREYRYGEDKKGVFMYCPVHRSVKAYFDQDGDIWMRTCNPPRPAREHPQTKGNGGW